MTMAPTRTKQVAEVRLMTFDYTTKLNTGDTVTGVVGGVLSFPGGITVSAPSLSGAMVTALVSGGSLGQTYRISCRVTTTQGETLELDVDVRVADGVN